MGLNEAEEAVSPSSLRTQGVVVVVVVVVVGQWDVGVGVTDRHGEGGLSPHKHKGSRGCE